MILISICFFIIFHGIVIYRLIKLMIHLLRSICAVHLKSFSNKVRTKITDIAYNFYF